MILFPLRTYPALLLVAFLLPGCDRSPPRPNDKAVIQNAITNSRYPREFHQLFPCAEHELGISKRRLPEGWQPVDEWNSRASMYDRYVVELRMAITIAEDGTISALEPPSFFVGEVTEVIKDDEDKFTFRLGEVHSLEEADWRKIVESTGDFTTMGIELRKDGPVEDFAIYWRESR